MTHAMHIRLSHQQEHQSATPSPRTPARTAATNQSKRPHLHLPRIHASTPTTPTMLLFPGHQKTLSRGTSATFLTSPTHSLAEEETLASAESSMHHAFPRDRIQVAVRLRPMLATTSTGQPKDHTVPGWSIVDGNQIVQKGIVRKTVGRNVFAMDSIFCESTPTRAVYERSVQPIIQSVFSGMHGTVFAYGQTGSGKTYTMQGGSATGNSRSHHDDGDDEGENQHEGIIAMAAAELFNMIQSAGPQQESTVCVSYYEVYNEEIRDLLVEPASSSTADAASRPQQRHDSATRRRRGMNGHATSVASCSSSIDTTGQRLTIRETPDGNVYVNARQETVSCAHDVVRLLHKGNCNRACAATDANSQSSRSHAIFKLTLETRIAPSGTTGATEQQANDLAPLKKRVSWINLVDLAGSENGRHTGATGARRLEGGKINQSLLALSRVIHSLSLPEKKRPKFIGYRDSKLTRILQPSLSGSACVAILCCASLARSDLEETRSTLKFASSAKQIKVKATVNECVVGGDNASAMEISKLKQELVLVKNELAQLKELLLQRSKPGEARISAIRPVFVGCIETTGSSITEDCSGTHGDDSTTSKTPHIQEEMELLNNDDGKADSKGDNDSYSTVSVGGGGDHSHTDRTVSRDGRTHMSDDDDDNSTLTMDVYSARSLPPLSEVKVLVRSAGAFPEESASPRGVANNTGADDRVVILQDKLEATEELVEKLYSELHDAIRMMQDENLGSMEELDERLARLEEDKDNTNDEEKILLGWFILLCFALYLCGMKDFCLSALIFAGLSLQFSSAL